MYYETEILFWQRGEKKCWRCSIRSRQRKQSSKSCTESRVYVEMNGDTSLSPLKFKLLKLWEWVGEREEWTCSIYYGRKRNDVPKIKIPSRLKREKTCGLVFMVNMCFTSLSNLTFRYFILCPLECWFSTQL